MEAEKNPLGYEPVGKLLISFSVPAIISCLINSVYNIVDQVFIGQGVGYLGNAATTVAFPIVTILLVFSTLIGAGSSAYAAIKLGEKQEEEAERTLSNAFLFTILAGVILVILGMAFMKPLLRLFGATENIMSYAVDYTSIILLGAPFNMLSIVLSNMARTDGSPRLSMYSMLIGAGLNTILDPIYIFVFHWGVKGAAVATITSQIISAVILTGYFLRKSKKSLHMRLKKEYMRLDWKRIGTFLSLGTASGITQAVACLTQIVMNNSLVYYGNQSEIGGDIALSAMGIVVKISMIMNAIAVGVGIGAQPILGYNRGAEKYDRIKKLYLRAVGMATLLVGAGWLICQALPGPIIALFGSESSAFTDFAVKCLRIYLLFIFCSGFPIVSTNYFQATGQALKASILSMLRQLLLLIPLILILPLFFGLDGVLYAAPAADILAAVIVLLVMIPEMKRLDRCIQGKS